jgi:DNA invertase Pin-like site-specific DNA recombinase
MPSSAPPPGYSYVRFSHPDQAKGDSLRRQTEAAAAWCEQNRVALDTSTTLHDLGKSAYTGEHRKNPDRHALAAFLKLVEAGKVPQGSYLVIENLDRLTREDEVPACHLLTGILMAGVRVVQLCPYEMLLTDKSNGWELMRAVMELSRGHGESALKSVRNGKAWKERRKNTREHKEILTHRLPAWVEVRDGKLEAIPSPAATVKHIFALAAAGYGAAGIVKKLTEDGTPAFGTGGHWARTYVALILADRRALGELQPRLSNGKADGDPIAGYFPEVVTEAEWNAARAGAVQRRRRQGRGRRWTEAEDRTVRTGTLREVAERLGRSVASVRARRSALANRGHKVVKKKGTSHYVNVFSGLLKDPHDGGNYYVSTRQSARYGKSWRVLLNINSAEGRAPARSFPFEIFERAVLKKLREIDPHEILNGDTGPDETLVLSGELARVEAKIAELEAELLQGDVAALAKVLRQLEAQKRDLNERLAEARQKAAHPLSVAWGESQSLIDALDSAPDPNDVRLRLRAAIRRIVQAAWLVAVARGRCRLCALQVRFAGGERYRDYLILRWPANADGQGRSTPGSSWAGSLAALVEPGELDLRKPAHAAKLEKLLARADLEKLEKVLTRLGVEESE